MKYSVAFLFSILLLSIGCKTEKKTEPAPTEKNLTILEKVAYAHGYENWANIEKIKFTFNVDRDSSHFERTWAWNVKENTVTSISSSDTLTYHRKEMDSTAQKVNGGFINDKYWFLAPYNLIWDKNNITHEHTQEAVAPISKSTMQKLTIVYGNEGGYTPGDAYDFYFGDDHIVKEWTFRRGNQAEPSSSRTWEGYMEESGLKLSTMHKTTDDNSVLYFNNIEVTTH